MRLPAKFTILLRLLVAVVIIVGALAPRQPARAIFDPLTIGGLLGLGGHVVGQLDGVVRTAGSEVRQTVQTLADSLRSLLNSIRDTYADSLNLTIDRLDGFTSAKLIEIQNMLSQINDMVQEDITLIGSEARSLLDRVNSIVTDLLPRLQNLITVAAGSAVYVIDRTLFGAIQIISLVLLGLGGLLFAYLLVKQRLPHGLLQIVVLALMVAYLAVFALLGLVPSIRAQAMNATGLGIENRLDKVTEPKPEIYAIEPSKIEIGKTESIRAHGVNLRIGDSDPTTQIGSSSVPVTAATDKDVVLNVSGLSLGAGSYTLVLSSGGKTTRYLVDVVRPVPQATPADLSISSFSINPTTPIRTRVVQATLTVRNSGGTAAEDFDVRWEPEPGAIRPVRVDRLEPGQSRSFTMNYTYARTGTFDMLASVDSANTVAESNEANNSLAPRRVTVLPQRASITVVFDRVNVPDDANDFGCTGIWMTFSVNTQSRIWGTRTDQKGFCDGDTGAPALSFALTLQEGENLVIRAEGRRAHAGYEGVMNAITATYLYSATNPWGSSPGFGEPRAGNNNPADNGGFSYRIEYRIVFNGWAN